MKNNIRLLMAIAFLQGMVFYGPVATLYRQAAGLSVYAITLTESACLLVSLALEVPWGVFADRFGYKRTFAICCALYLASKLIFWQAAGFGAFLAERVLLGIVIAGLSGLDVSLLYLSAPAPEHQRILGRYEFAGNAGLILAALIYSWLIGPDYRLAALLTVIAYALALILALFLKEVRPAPEPSRGRPEILRQFRSLFGSPARLAAVSGIAIFSEVRQLTVVFLAQLKYQEVRLGSGPMGIAFAMAAAASLASLGSAAFTKRWGRKRAAALLFLAGAFSAILLASQANQIVSLGAVVLMAAAYSLFSPLAQDYQDELITAADRATALSLDYLVIDLTGALADPVFGALADHSLSLVFSLSALCLAAGLAAFLWSANKKGPAGAGPKKANR